MNFSPLNRNSSHTRPDDSYKKNSNKKRMRIKGETGCFGAARKRWEIYKFKIRKSVF